MKRGRTFEFYMNFGDEVFSCFHFPVDDCTMLLENVGSHQPEITAPQPRRPESSLTFRYLFK